MRIVGGSTGGGLWQGEGVDVHVSQKLIIPAAELTWRFSRASGPGGQHVNTTDTRVQVSWDVSASTVLSESQRRRLLSRLGSRHRDGVVTVSSSEHRSQMRNREEASGKLADLIGAALAPPPRRRRPTKPTRGSMRRHQESKRRRSETKKLRRRPPLD